MAAWQHGRRARAKSSSVSSRVIHTSRVELLAAAQWTAGRDSVEALHPFGLKLATHVAEPPEALATLGLSGCQAARPLEPWRPLRPLAELTAVAA